MIQTEKKLIREEQSALDRIIEQMDDALRLLGRIKEQSAKDAENAKGKSLPDTYGELISSHYHVSWANSISQSLRRGKDELYSCRIITDCYSPHDDETDEIEMPIGLHTYSFKDKIYIYSWVRPVCRHFIMENMSTEYEAEVEGKNGELYRSYYKLKQKREVEIFFDRVKKVQHLFPLTETEAEKLVYDSFLQELLKRRSEQEFRNIVFSIQKKQGEIIQAPFSRNIIVQGCAGSGKSMIMLHRLPIILFDNEKTLSRSNLYIITPSSTYIEMSGSMRSELEIDDLKMGTLNQYYDHVIRKYGSDPSGYGTIHPHIELQKEQIGFVYSQELQEYIQEQIQTMMQMHSVDLSEAFRQLNSEESRVTGKCPVQLLRSEVKAIQEALGIHVANCRQYTDAIEAVILELDRLRTCLTNKALIQEIEALISREKSQIDKYHAELNDTENQKPVSFYKGRKRLIRSAQDRIIFYQEEIKAVEKDKRYLLKIEELTEQINRLLKLYTQDVSNRSKTALSDETQYQRISSTKMLAAASLILCRQVEETEEPYIEYLPAIESIIQSLYPAIDRLSRVDSPVLNPEQSGSLRKRSDYLQGKGKTFTDDIYANVMERLGQEKNRKGTFDALTCSPYVYLQILYHLEGPPNQLAENMIAIDEAQNLAVEELRLLKAVNKEQAVFNLYGDIRQHVEKSKGVDDWNDLSAVIPFTIYDLAENYRNARQITEYCNSLFHMNMLAINLDGSGVHLLPSQEGLFDHIAEVLKKPLKPGLSCIIVKSEKEAETVLNGLKSLKNKIHDLTVGPAPLYPNRWNMITVSQAKGLEFETVIVFSGRMTENEKYIAYTRALDELYIYDSEIYLKTKLKVFVNDDVKDKHAEYENTKTAVRKKRKKRSSSEIPVSVTKAPEPFVPVKEFFEQKGLTVIDDRKKSGYLWVLGTENEIGDAVSEAVSLYGISGSFGSGKTSKFKRGWFTKSKK